MRVEDLSGAERFLWDAFPLGESLDVRVGEAAEDDPAAGGAWGQDRSVRAAVVAALLLGALAPVPGRVPAVRLFGARVTGVLDLSFADVRHAVLLQDCFFEEEPRLDGARTRLVSLSRSHLPGLSMSDAQIDGLLLLGGCHFHGPVGLTGTHVTQTLSLKDSVVSGDPALAADSLSVSRNMVCTGVVVRGEVLLGSARIGGRLMFDGARLENPGGMALAADGLIADRGVFCDPGFTAAGEVRLHDARIGGRLTMAGASLCNPGGTALGAERLTVDGTLQLNGGFSAQGEITLRGAALRGGLELGSAKIDNAPGVALNAGRTTIETGVYATGGFIASGEVQLDGAHVLGSINLAGASLMNPGGTALLADRLDVQGRFFCGPEFTAQGNIRLAGARIGAGMYFNGSRLSSSAGPALLAWGLTVGGIVNCCDGFTADALVSFISARIGSELCFETATIHADLELSQLRAAVLRTDSGTVITGTLDLRHAFVEVLRDDPAGWPRDARLDGFTYTTLVSLLPAASRLGWLARDPDGYHPQPYEHLAAAYRAMGDDADARTILLAKHRTRRRTLSAPLRAWGHIQDWMVGYGYRPQRAALWLSALLIAGAIAFAARHPPPLTPGRAPEFNPLLYSIDLLLPIAPFGQRAAFNPHGWQHWLAAGLIAAGWILATTIAAGITRVLSRK
jgi:hypothetical protein